MKHWFWVTATANPYTTYGHSLFQIFLWLRRRNIEFKMWSGFIFRSRWWWVSTTWKVWSSKFDIFLISSADVISMTSSLRYHLWRHHRSIHSYLSSFHTFQSHMWLTYILPICKFFFPFYKLWRHSIVLMTSPWCQMVQKCFAPSNFIKIYSQLYRVDFRNYFLSNFSSTAQFT